ncbi:MAG: helix-turn-helix domain-containing protein [Candidatus Odinarchaeota archaeon]
MVKMTQALNELIKSESKTIAATIIKGENDIEYSTENWDISNDIDEINLAWESEEYKTLILSNIKYVIIQRTPERLVGIDPSSKGGILGFKDEERKIIGKIAPDGLKRLGMMEVSRILGKLSSKKPYIDFDTQLGKVEELKWATPRILLDDTNNLQELGLLKFGLSIEEAKVYLTLLKKGKEGAKVGELNEDLSIKRTTIYRIIDRLISKSWVIKLPLMPKSAQNFIARPLNDIFDERIQKKEEELKILKSFRYIMGETLENGWIDISEIKKDFQLYSKKAFDFNTLGIMGEEKDCGLIIFEYNKKIKEEIIIKAALQLSSEKMREPIQPDLDKKAFTIPDLEDIKIEDTKIQDYFGMTMYFKFKEGTETGNNVGLDWIVAARHVAVPIENKIYVVWGSEEQFPILLSIILKL